MYAVPQDVVDIWADAPAMTPGLETLLARRIEEAESVVSDEVGLIAGLTIDERVEAGSLPAKTVKQVVVAMVHRVVSVPGYVRQYSRSVDDGSESYTIDSSVSSGELHVSASELRRLSGTGRRRSRYRAYTITPGRGVRL
jgi:hypothetical protein